MASLMGKYVQCHSGSEMRTNKIILFGHPYLGVSRLPMNLVNLQMNSGQQCWGRFYIRTFLFFSATN